MSVHQRYFALVVGVILAASMSSCGDDGNDQMTQQLRLSELAARAGEPAVSTRVTDTSVTRAAATDTELSEPAESTMPAVTPTGVIVAVQALDNSFRPEVVEIDVGDEVLWENRGMNEHDALYVDGDDWGVVAEQFQPGDVYTHVFSEPGEYRYYCSIHGSTEVGMVGTVIVRG